MDANLTEEERRQRELRRRERERERERRHRENRDKKPVSRKLDIIDQLDATSIYGTGSGWHGPVHAWHVRLLTFAFFYQSSTMMAPLTP